MFDHFGKFTIYPRLKHNKLPSVNLFYLLLTTRLLLLVKQEWLINSEHRQSLPESSRLVLPNKKYCLKSLFVFSVYFSGVIVLFSFLWLMIFHFLLPFKQKFVYWTHINLATKWLDYVIEQHYVYNKYRIFLVLSLD